MDGAVEVAEGEELSAAEALQKIVGPKSVPLDPPPPPPVDHPRQGVDDGVEVRRDEVS
jgi:hypothetical protein